MKRHQISHDSSLPCLARLALVCAISFYSGALVAESIVVSSTTSTEQSGLFGHILPKFKASSGIDVRVVAGTGHRTAR